MQYRSSWMTEELDVFRDQFRKFLAKDLAPHAEKWRDQKMVDRFAWRALGEMGALLPSVPEAYGGGGRRVGSGGGWAPTKTNTHHKNQKTTTPTNTQKTSNMNTPQPKTYTKKN